MRRSEYADACQVSSTFGAEQAGSAVLVHRIDQDHDAAA
jgi:hypothetical protein